MGGAVAACEDAGLVPVPGEIGSRVDVGTTAGRGTPGCPWGTLPETCDIPKVDFDEEARAAV
jgi:hypothetical protein